MKRLWAAAWLMPVLLAVIFWWSPPRGDDSYYHSVASVEQVREWREGGVVPRYHRGWNGGTGSFAPTVYAPVPMMIQGGLAAITGDGQRAVGLSLVLAMAAGAGFLVAALRRWEGAVLVVMPYVLALAVTRATTTEAWALAGAALVLAIGTPPGATTPGRGLALAAGVVLVAGSQLGMLLQLGLLMTVAWLVWLLLPNRRDDPARSGSLAAGVTTVTSAIAGFLSAGVLWLPSVLDGHNLALTEAVAGPFDWRSNFLPGHLELGLVLTAMAAALTVVIVMVALRGGGGDRLPLVAAALTALFLTLPLSAPLWHLPGMAYLQFPWRFLGPATVLAVMMLGSFDGRWRGPAVLVLLLPCTLVPFRLDPVPGGIPVAATPEKLARLVQEHWQLVPVLPSAQGFYAPGFDRMASLRQLFDQEAVIDPQQRSATGGEWRVEPPRPTRVLLPIQWWHEWRIVMDGREIPYSNSGGLVAIEFPGGPSTVVATLMPSRSRAIGGAVSVVGLILLGVHLWLVRRRGSGRMTPRGSL